MTLRHWLRQTLLGKTATQGAQTKSKALDPILSRLLYHIGPLGPPVSPEATLQAREDDLVRWEGELTEDGIVRLIEWVCLPQMLPEDIANFMQRHRDEAAQLVGGFARRFPESASIRRRLCEGVDWSEEKSTALTIVEELADLWWVERLAKVADTSNEPVNRKRAQSALRELLVSAVGIAGSKSPTLLDRLENDWPQSESVKVALVDARVEMHHCGFD